MHQQLLTPLFSFASALPAFILPALSLCFYFIPCNVSRLKIEKLLIKFSSIKTQTLASSVYFWMRKSFDIRYCFFSKSQLLWKQTNQNTERASFESVKPNSMFNIGTEKHLKTTIVKIYYTQLTLSSNFMPFTWKQNEVCAVLISGVTFISTVFFEDHIFLIR